MARFYFHLLGGDAPERDEIGSEHADANQAYLEAFEAAQQLTVDLIREHRSPAGYGFEICDAQGRTVFQLPFAEIIGRWPSKHELTETSVLGHRLVSELKDQIVTTRTSLLSLRATVARL